MPRLRFAAPLGVALGLLLALPPSALAECPAPDPWPSFREAATTARQLLIARVTDGLSSDAAGNLVRFHVRVDEDLRGDSPPTLDVDGLVSNAPARFCQPMLRVNVGDLIALALDARHSGDPGLVNSVAYIEGNPPDHPDMVTVERLTAAQVRALAKLPVTDSVASSNRDSFTVSPVLLAIAIGVLAVVVLAFLLIRRTFVSEPPPP